MAFDAKVIADSVSPYGCRLTTIEVTLPRIVLSEFNTHRMFSRNSASSRAIPVVKRIEQIAADPFVPSYWGANQPGMQSEQSLQASDAAKAEAVWRKALNDALEHAAEMAEIGAHKQLANRLLEAFMWQTILVTATEWDNFFALRDNPMAQPEIHEAARLMRAAYNDSTPSLVRMGEWHLPLIQPDERDGTFEHSELARRVSAARCARVSYLTHDGTRDVYKDLGLYERLHEGGHMSPFEHVATPLSSKEKFMGNFRGWKQLRKFMPNEDNFGARGPH